MKLDLAFLCDTRITEGLNDLNVKPKGRENLITRFYDKIKFLR